MMRSDVKNYQVIFKFRQEYIICCEFHDGYKNWTKPIRSVLERHEKLASVLDYALGGKPYRFDKIGVVVAVPGAKTAWWHSDGPGQDTVDVFIPLRDFALPSTEFWIDNRSYKPLYQKRSAFVYTYDVTHRALEYKEHGPRLMLYAIATANEDFTDQNE